MFHENFNLKDSYKDAGKKKASTVKKNNNTALLLAYIYKIWIFFPKV